MECRRSSGVPLSTSCPMIKVNGILKELNTGKAANGSGLSQHTRQGKVTR